MLTSFVKLFMVTFSFFGTVWNQQLYSTTSQSNPTLSTPSPTFNNFEICDSSSDKLITDVWSINNLLYIKLLHFKNDSSNAIECRIFVYDQQTKRFLDVLRFPSAGRQYGNGTTVRDVVAKSLSKTQSNHTFPLSPSIIYFYPRNILRSGCQNRWLYVPPSSQFCRGHPIVSHLYRTLAVIDPTSIVNMNQADIQLFRFQFQRDDFSLSTLKPIVGSFRNDQKREVLEQYITNSVLTLQVNHQIMPPSHQNVRFIFSNNLGLFIAWYPSTFANFENDPPVNCAVMIPIKNKPYIRLCSQRYNFVSFVEINETLYVVLPENQMVALEHDYIKKQYRIMNNLQLNLDQFQPVNFFQQFFKCLHPPPVGSLFKHSKTLFNPLQPTTVGNNIN